MNIRWLSSSAAAALSLALALPAPGHASPLQVGAAPPEATATTPAPTAQTAPPPLVLPVGTQFSAFLDTHLSTHRSDPGDRFGATVVTPVVDAQGRVIIPAGAYVEGYVHASERGHGYSGIPYFGLTAQRLIVNGVAVPINAQLVDGDFEFYRRGWRARPEVRLHTGAQVTFSLLQPVDVATLQRALGGYAIGGGPGG